MRQCSPMHTPSPMTAPASMRVPLPMLAYSPTTAQGPMLTPSPSSTCAPTTAAGCTPVAGSAGVSSLAARANHNRGCSATTTHLPCGSSGPHPAFSTTTPALLASALAADAASSAKISSASPASSTEFTPLTGRFGSPATSLPPNASINSPSFMRLSLLQPRLARRPRSPAAMNPQPLVRIAPNPALAGAGTQLRGSHNVCLVVGGALEGQLRAEVQHVAPFGLLQPHEARQNGRPCLQRHARHSRTGAGLLAEKIHEDALRRGHVRVHQKAPPLPLAHAR